MAPGLQRGFGKIEGEKAGGTADVPFPTATRRLDRRSGQLRRYCFPV